jgi:hypothetical protein
MLEQNRNNVYARQTMPAVSNTAPHPNQTNPVLAFGLVAPFVG